MVSDAWVWLLEAVGYEPAAWASIFVDAVADAEDMAVVTVGQMVVDHVASFLQEVLLAYSYLAAFAGNPQRHLPARA